MVLFGEQNLIIQPEVSEHIIPEITHNNEGMKLYLKCSITVQSQIFIKFVQLNFRSIQVFVLMLSFEDKPHGFFVMLR